MGKQNVEELVAGIANPIVKELNLDLVDVEFVKEGPNWYLRTYIDKQGGVTIDDCETVSKKISKQLDIVDPIEQSYFLEVSSPGIDRPLKKDSDFANNKGRTVEVRLYKPIDGNKAYKGELIGQIDNKIIIKDNGKEITFDKKDVSLVKLYVEL